MDRWRIAPVVDSLAKPGILEIPSIQTLPLICYSHLRWDFVFQRPQHLMTRAARDRKVFYWEEPIFRELGDPETSASLSVRPTPSGVTVVTPVLAHGTDQSDIIEMQRLMLDEMLMRQQIAGHTAWYYTPQALPFSGHTGSTAIVYDCMDELSAFLGADPGLPVLERDLLAKASIVFTGGLSLYDVKRKQHHDVHAFPSGVDVDHFRPARQGLPVPSDQQSIPHPRLGFYGVIDERFDAPLLTELAALRPDWQIILIGPIVKVDPAALPRASNIHYLGSKPYDALPAYLSSWDVALIPFARNNATRFISPTKTPEYLAAGRPVVSTPIFDVARHYGHLKAVRIADTASAFVTAVEEALLLTREPECWRSEADAQLALAGWDSIWQRMASLIGNAGESTFPRSELVMAQRA